MCVLPVTGKTFKMVVSWSEYSPFLQDQFYFGTLGVAVATKTDNPYTASAGFRLRTPDLDLLVTIQLKYLIRKSIIICPSTYQNREY